MVKQGGVVDILPKHLKEQCEYLIPYITRLIHLQLIPAEDILNCRTKYLYKTVGQVFSHSSTEIRKQ